MEPISDEIVLAGVVAAILVGLYLLRHIIAFAFKLLVFAGLVLAGIWAWQHRADMVDAAGPYLGPVADLMGNVDLSDVRNLLADLLAGEEPDTAGETGVTDVTGVIEDLGRPDAPDQPGGAVGPDGQPGPDGLPEPDDSDQPPTAPE